MFFRRVHTTEDDCSDPRRLNWQSTESRHGFTIFSTRWTKVTNTEVSQRSKERSGAMINNEKIKFSPINSSLYYSFCPRIVIGHHDNADIDYSKRQKSIHCCCLIVDISGFTSLSSDLCDQGNRGLDKLRRIVNEYFGKLVGVIHSKGGDGKKC
jgi:hypothetical protein